MKRKLGLLALTLALAAPLAACDGKAPDVAPSPAPSPNTVTKGMEDMARGVERGMEDMARGIDRSMDRMARDNGTVPDDTWTESFMDAEEFDEFTTGTGRYAYAPPGGAW